MKISKLKKHLVTGIDFAQDIKQTTRKDDLKIVRCILGQDEKNISAVLRFLGIFPPEWNKVIRLGIYLELIR